VKPIAYSGHAEARMAQRGIRSEEVEATVRNPGIVLPPEDGKQRVIGSVGRRSLNVVYEETNEEIRIVTAYWMDT